MVFGRKKGDAKWHTIGEPARRDCERSIVEHVHEIGVKAKARI